MFCNTCGTELKEGQKFCTNCGAEAKPRLVGAEKPSKTMPAHAKPVPWASRRMKIFLWALGGFIIICILAAIVSSSLNTARQKAMGATSIEQTDGWQSYNSVADKFSILFPEYPTYESETDTSGDLPYTYHTYKAVKDQTSFEIFKYIYQDEIDVSQPDDLLERFLNGFVDGVGNGKLVSSNYTYVGQYRALEFKVSTTGNEEVKGKLVLVGQTPYLIAIDYFTQNYNDADYQKFVSSFNPQ